MSASEPTLSERAGWPMDPTLYGHSREWRAVHVDRMRQGREAA